MDQRLHNSQRLILLSVYWQWVKLTQQTCQHDSNREHHLVWGTASHNRAAAPLISSLRILMAYVKSLLWGFRCTFGWWITTRKPHQTRPQVFKLYIQILTGWWFDSTPLKNMKVSWDDYIPNIWKVIKFHGSSHHQPVKHDSNIFFFVTPALPSPTENSIPPKDSSSLGGSLDFLPHLHQLPAPRRAFQWIWIWHITPCNGLTWRGWNARGAKIL